MRSVSCSLCGRLALARHFFSLGRQIRHFVCRWRRFGDNFSSKSDIRQENPKNFVTLNCIGTDLPVVLFFLTKLFVLSCFVSVSKIGARGCLLFVIGFSVITVTEHRSNRLDCLVCSEVSKQNPRAFYRVQCLWDGSAASVVSAVRCVRRVCSDL